MSVRIRDRFWWVEARSLQQDHIEEKAMLLRVGGVGFGPVTSRFDAKLLPDSAAIRARVRDVCEDAPPGALSTVGVGPGDHATKASLPFGVNADAVFDRSAPFRLRRTSAGSECAMKRREPSECSPAPLQRFSSKCCKSPCHDMLISVLIPAYARPEQLGEALASIAQQDRALIGEIIIGDDSPRAYWDRNRAVIAASGLADLIEYIPSEPSRGTYPNQWFLGTRAKCGHLLFLHNDDMLCPGALRALADACVSETDTLVKLWFGRNLIMDEDGRVDPVRSADNERAYGKTGGARAQPMWQWCLTAIRPPRRLPDCKGHLSAAHAGTAGRQRRRLGHDGAARQQRRVGPLHRSTDFDVSRPGGLRHQCGPRHGRPPATTNSPSSCKYRPRRSRKSRARPRASPPWRRCAMRGTVNASMHGNAMSRATGPGANAFPRRGVMALIALSMPRPLWTWALRNRD